MLAQQTGRHFRHFQAAATVEELIAEIKGRHGCSYEALLEPILRQISDYFVLSFVADTPPSRFAAASGALVRPRLLVGLSGGIDSTVVTYLAVRAVGRDAVLPVTMPGRPDDDSLPLAALVR